MKTLRSSIGLVALAAILVPACAADLPDVEENVDETEQAFTVTCTGQKIFFDGACRGEPWIQANLLSTGAILQTAAGKPKGNTLMSSGILVFQQRSATNFQTIEYTTGSSPVTMNGYGVKHLWTTEFRENTSGEPELYVTRRDPRPAIGYVPAGLVTQWWQRTTWKGSGTRETCDSTGACVTAYALGAEDCADIGAAAKMIYVPVCQVMVLGSTLVADGGLVFLLGGSAGTASPILAPAITATTGLGVAGATLICPNVGTVVGFAAERACGEFAEGDDPTDDPPVFPPTYSPPPVPGGGGGDAEPCPDYQVMYQYSDPRLGCCTVFSDCTGYGVDADGTCAYECSSSPAVCLQDGSTESCNDVEVIVEP